ncbi:VanZ family protein [Drancourtella sp. An12]|uniref:VanZ family protein n=1 Tax=Drancourtella sp. An12 TaxID=1965548 RepID=UPI00112213FD|nr:VanZ family protein [Drancourtella sp. An12]
MWELFQRLFEKAVWFLKLYVIEYRYLVAFLACFVFLYILFMHWLNIRFFRILREPVAIICLVVEIVAIAYFTIFFREQGESHTYELELFWSYKKWILEGSVAFGLEILNNIVLFFPFGFILTDALRRCPFWAVLLSSLAVSGCIEMSQLVFRLGLFEFDDIFNNVLGAVAGWCVFHILRSFKRRRRPESSSVYSG